MYNSYIDIPFILIIFIENRFGVRICMYNIYICMCGLSSLGLFGLRIEEAGVEFDGTLEMFCTYIE